MLTHTYIIIGVDHRCEQRFVPLAVLQVTEHFYINVDRSAIKISTHLYRDAQPEEFRHFNSFRYLLHHKHYTWSALRQVLVYFTVFSVCVFVAKNVETLSKGDWQRPAIIIECLLLLFVYIDFSRSFSSFTNDTNIQFNPKPQSKSKLALNYISYNIMGTYVMYVTREKIY